MGMQNSSVKQCVVSSGNSLNCAVLVLCLPLGPGRFPGSFDCPGRPQCCSWVAQRPPPNDASMRSPMQGRSFPQQPVQLKPSPLLPPAGPIGIAGGGLRLRLVCLPASPLQPQSGNALAALLPGTTACRQAKPSNLGSDMFPVGETGR